MSICPQDNLGNNSEKIKVVFGKLPIHNTISSRTLCSSSQPVVDVRSFEPRCITLVGWSGDTAVEVFG